jgi:uncharacterized repeat protein (TIGR04138 family)
MAGKKNLEQIAEEDGRYNPKAVRFVYEGLGFAIKKMMREPGHISGQVLCEALRTLALERWGRLAMLVLNSWGIKTTGDFGEIVWLMIQNHWMRAQPTDSLDDFNNIYDFASVFKTGFSFSPGDARQGYGGAIT